MNKKIMEGIFKHKPRLVTVLLLLAVSVIALILAYNQFIGRAFGK